MQPSPGAVKLWGSRRTEEVSSVPVLQKVSGIFSAHVSYGFPRGSVLRRKKGAEFFYQNSVIAASFFPKWRPKCGIWSVFRAINYRT